MAIKGVAHALRGKGKHLITSGVEHHAVYDAMGYLQKEGYDVTFLPVDAGGLVAPADLRAALRDDTILVSVMLANNEVGTIEPVRELAAIAKERGVLFHTTRCRRSAPSRLTCVHSGSTCSRSRRTSFTAPRVWAPCTRGEGSG